MRKLLSVVVLAACFAVPALGQTPETQVPEPVWVQTLPPCEVACCFGEFDAGTECSYYSPNYGYQPYSQCYWWWSDGGICSI